MGPKPALALLTLLSPLLLLGLAIDLDGFFLLLIPVICALPVLLLAVGGQPLRPPSSLLAAVWLLLSGGWMALWLLSATVGLERPRPDLALWVLAILLLVITGAPLLILGLAYAKAQRGERQ